MTNWRSCGNCDDYKCYKHMVEIGLEKGMPCDDWEPIPCKRCGGALSEIREHNGKRYRHCYSCHFEFEEDGN